MVVALKIHKTLISVVILTSFEQKRGRQVDKEIKINKIPNQQSTTHLCAKEHPMILKAFTIRDSKGEVFNTPFFQNTHGEAERNFRELVNDSQSMPSKYPEDYDLYYAGDYDNATGKFMPLDTPQHVVKATAVVNQKQ